MRSGPWSKHLRAVGGSRRARHASGVAIRPCGTRIPRPDAALGGAPVRRYHWYRPASPKRVARRRLPYTPSRRRPIPHELQAIHGTARQPGHRTHQHAAGPCHIPSDADRAGHRRSERQRQRSGDPVAHAFRRPEPREPVADQGARRRRAESDPDPRPDDKRDQWRGGRPRPHYEHGVPDPGESGAGPGLHDGQSHPGDVPRGRLAHVRGRLRHHLLAFELGRRGLHGSWDGLAQQRRRWERQSAVRGAAAVHEPAGAPVQERRDRPERHERG